MSESRDVCALQSATYRGRHDGADGVARHENRAQMTEA